MVDDLAVIDTDVYSKVLLATRDSDPRVAQWRRLLLGRQILIAAQTEGELRFGALARGWGPDSVRAGCKTSGNPLADKHHMGDAWIAATAVAYRLPLLSGDRVYVGVDGLELLGDLDD